jgi:hypothetical protein
MTKYLHVVCCCGRKQLAETQATCGSLQFTGTGTEFLPANSTELYAMVGPLKLN